MRLSFPVALLAAAAAALPATQAEARRHRRPRPIPPTQDSKRLCLSEEQYEELLKYPIKKGCFEKQPRVDFYCALRECVGQIIQGDFDYDGKKEKVFSLLMLSEKDPPAGDERAYWGVFTFLTSTENKLHSIDFGIRPNLEKKGFFQARVQDSEGNPYPGLSLVASEGEKTAARAFEKKTKKFVPTDTLTHYEEGDPDYGYPGVGISLVAGILFLVPSGGNAGGVGAQFGGRLDGYLTRYFSLNTGFTYALQNFTELEYPLEARFWFVPQFYLGGGATLISIQSGGAGTQTVPGSSSLDWLGSIGWKSRVRQTRFYLFWDLDFMGNGTGVNFHSYGGFRYGFGAE